MTKDQQIGGGNENDFNDSDDGLIIKATEEIEDYLRFIREAQGVDDDDIEVSKFIHIILLYFLFKRVIESIPSNPC